MLHGHALIRDREAERLETLTPPRGESLYSMFTPASNQLIAALEQLGPHDHLCSFYENQQEQFAVSIPFLRIGLGRGEKCVYIGDRDTIAEPKGQKTQRL